MKTRKRKDRNGKREIIRLEEKSACEAVDWKLRRPKLPCCVKKREVAFDEHNDHDVVSHEKTSYSFDVTGMLFCS